MRRKFCKVLLAFLLSTKNICFSWGDISLVDYKHHCLPVRDNVYNLAFLSRLVTLLNLFCQKLLFWKESTECYLGAYISSPQNKNVNRTRMHGLYRSGVLWREYQPVLLVLALFCNNLKWFIYCSRNIRFCGHSFFIRLL